MSQTLPLIEFPKQTLDWNEVFAAPRPVQVEIGSGKGRFLIRAAERDPGSNWVGLERRWSSLALGVERIVKSGLTNVVYVRCDGMEVVRRYLPQASVSAFHVYYPDPWWKERHRKRRVFQPPFVADLARGLTPGGQLRMTTDVGEYFAEILDVIGASGLFAPLELDDEAWGTAGEPLTSYEAKYVVQGRSPLRAAFARGPAPAPPPEPWISRKPAGTPLGERLIRPRLARHH